jgi:hypothetical protein
MKICSTAGQTLFINRRKLFQEGAEFMSKRELEEVLGGHLFN